MTFVCFVVHILSTTNIECRYRRHNRRCRIQYYILFFLKWSKQLWKANLCSDFQLTVYLLLFYQFLCVPTLTTFCYVVFYKCKMCKFFLHTGWNMWLSWKSNNNNKNRLHGSFFLFGDIVNNVTFVARYTFDGKHCILNGEIVNQTFPTQQ